MLMKKVILWNLLILFPFCAKAQRQTEYNQKGDAAMQRMDYQDALMWYEEGVSYCDPYSISQLTAIWKADKTTHVSMEPVMSKCLNCLNNSAVSKDSLAIKKLILFYTEGIGTSKQEVSANYWREQLELLRTPSQAELFRPKRPKEKMKFFAGYSFTPAAPFGIQIGGVGTIGWYLRARSNLSFSFHPDAPGCENGLDGKGIIPSLDEQKETYHFLPEGTTELAHGKESLVIGTAGVVFKAFSNIYLSAGVGYAKYDLIYEYEKIDKVTAETMPETRGWARHRDSYEGVAIDLDATGVFGKRFYGTLGCSILNFSYIYPSIGVGVFLNLK